MRRLGFLLLALCLCFPVVGCGGGAADTSGGGDSAPSTDDGGDAGSGTAEGGDSAEESDDAASE